MQVSTIELVFQLDPGKQVLGDPWSGWALPPLGIGESWWGFAVLFCQLNHLVLPVAPEPID